MQNSRKTIIQAAGRIHIPRLVSIPSKSDGPERKYYASVASGLCFIAETPVYIEPRSRVLSAHNHEVNFDSSQRRITLPDAARRQAGFNIGDEVEISSTPNYLLIRKQNTI